MDKKFVIWTIIITLFIMVGGVLAATNLGNQTEIVESPDAKLSLAQTDHDWGDIDIQGGVVEATFPITNSGESTLKLYNVTTSCACTSATLTLGDMTSSPFGMHSKSKYVMEVPPGETAVVTAVFDPLFHGPDAVGAITREVTLETNDATHKVLTFNITANVVKE